MLVYAYPGNERFADGLAAGLGARRGIADWHRFPDGETLVRIETSPAGERACLVCTLADPDPKVLPLLFAADTLRELGAAGVGLVAPYLAYMRQDARFHPGEALSARGFCKLLSEHFDWIATVDPHLHRTKQLADVFPGSAHTAHAAAALAGWIRTNLKEPFLIGPDGESAQWVSAVAGHAGAPWTSLVKERLGDREVRVSLPQSGDWRGRMPVLVDDIISSGQTLAAAAKMLQSLGFPPPACVAVHGVFAAGARAALQAADVARIAVTNTIPQPEAVIDVVPLLAEGIAGLAAGGGGTG